MCARFLDDEEIKPLMPSFCLGGDPVGRFNDHCPQARRSSPSLVSDLGFTAHFYICFYVLVFQLFRKK